MFEEIKSKIEIELSGYIRSVDKAYSLKKISPVLFENIKEFISRRGKRARPILFTIGYLGFTDKPADGLYRSAVSIELLHDFMLVHDDIIDKSDTRRGLPSMHKMLNNYLARYKKLKFNGQDLTIVAGDVLFAIAMHSFLSIKEEPVRKEAALKKLIEAALYTGSGEFVELLEGAKNIASTRIEDIYKIYDLKTANYTFAAPLAIGATLAGANKAQTEKIFNYGIHLGRAFQIKDDIIGLFSEEAQIGKSNLTDLQEAKKTILIWHAFFHSGRKNREAIKTIFSKDRVTRSDLLRIRSIVIEAGSLDFAKREIDKLRKRADYLIRSSSMRKIYKDALVSYSSQILDTA